MKKILYGILALTGIFAFYRWLIYPYIPESHTMKEWAEMPDRISVKNKFYAVSDFRTDETTDVPRFKFGDGKTLISKLPFCTAAVTENDVEKWDTMALKIESEEK